LAVRRGDGAAPSARASLRAVALTRDRVGDVVAGRYELADVVGRGGQGLVYRGFDRWMGRPVAIKLLDSAAARDPKLSERMVREQQALSVLKGTAAVELFDVCRGADGELCLVMELLSGIDLEEQLYVLEERGEKLELRRVAEIFDPIVETLGIAHDAGILHRDLKPANVFLLDYGGVRLLDFGLARLRSGAPLTAAGTVMGSPSYIAPEGWTGHPERLDHRADVYSLGVILYRVLAGELPFSGESLQEKFRGSTLGERPSLCAKRPDLGRDSDEWVTEALAVDREERFQNVGALWNAFLSTFDVEPPQRRKRKKGIWGVAKRAFGRIAGDEPAAPPAGEPSFVRNALAASVSPDASAVALVSLLDAPAPPLAREATLELTEEDFEKEPPPLRREPVDKTVELTDVDLILAEDTIPTAPAPPVDADQEERKKKEKRRRRKNRRKRGKKRKGR
jgi:eukaryotic-like serine/threonine-protein kinase